ncbi:hypothetical protein AB7W67_07100 [Providencia rettgeri]
MREVKPTQKPVPSSDIKDLFFNSGLLDIWATSLERKYIDRFGNCHLTAAGMEWLFKELVEKFKVDMNTAIVAAGYITIDSFQQGADLPNNELTQRNHILRDETTGEYYRWDGYLPKPVLAGSTPESTGGIGKGAWVSVGDASLRGNLGSEDGLSLIGGTNYDGLRSYTGSNDKIRIYGVNNVFDGGYGDFSLDRNDKTSADNSVNILVDKINRRWKRKHSGAILPRFSGVVGDGIADDSNSCRLLIQAFKEKGVQAARGVDMQGQAIDWSGYTCKLSEPLDLSGMYNYTFINPTFTAANSFSGTELIRIASTVQYLQLDGITFINPNLDAKWNTDYCIRASDFLKFMVIGGRITHYNKKGILTGEGMASAHELSLNGTIILQKDYEEDYPTHVTEGEAFEINNYDNEFVNVIIAFQKSWGGTLNKGANRFIGGHIYSGKPLRSLDQSDDFVGTYFDMTPLIVKERTSVQSCVFLIGSAKYAIDLISTAPYLVKVTNNRFRSQDTLTGSVIKMKAIAEGRTVRPAIFDNQYDRCEGISTRGNLYKTINNDTETIAVPDAMLPLSSVGSVCISESVTQDYANRTFSAGYNAASELITIRTFRIWPDGKTLPDTVSGKLVIVPVNI